MTATQWCVPCTGTSSRGLTSSRSFTSRPRRFAHNAALRARRTNARLIISIAKFEAQDPPYLPDRFAVCIHQPAYDVARGYPRPLPDCHSPGAQGLRWVPKYHWAYVAGVCASSHTFRASVAQLAINRVATCPFRGIAMRRPRCRKRLRVLSRAAALPILSLVIL